MLGVVALVLFLGHLARSLQVETMIRDVSAGPGVPSPASCRTVVATATTTLTAVTERPAAAFPQASRASCGDENEIDHHEAG